MIDFGIVTLLVLQLLIAGACAAAYLRIASAMADYRKTNGDSKSAEAIAREALAKVVDLDTGMYQAIVRRLFVIEGTQDKWNRTLTDYLDEVKTLSARISALKRWSTEKARKGPEEPEPEQQDPPNEPEHIGQQENIFQSNFGKKINRKAG